MNDLTRTRNFQLLQFATLLLAAFAFLNYLGYVPIGYVDDESRRVLVAKEMMLSGDFISPTLNGEAFLNKPPLYNWIIFVFMKLFGENAFAVRLPVILSIFAFSYIIYRFVKKYTDNKLVAYVAALAFMTNGRTLFYDSLIGLIDTTFSVIMYVSIILVFHFGSKQKWAPLFISTYILTAIGFMMKGLPAIASQGLTLLAYFISTRNFKKLFVWQHLAGGLLFIFLLSFYYFFYFSRSGLDAGAIFGNLLNESTKRTVAQQGWASTILHLFTFPFEMFYHFAPWLLLSFVFFKKGSWKVIRGNNFIWFNLVALLYNLSIYWISPRVHPRYLFMLLPLYLTVIVYLFYIHLKASDWQRKAVEWMFGVLCVIACIAMPALPFIPQTAHLPSIWFKALLIFGISGFICYFYFKYPSLRLLYFLMMLVVVRIMFNWAVLYQRAAKPEAIKDMSNRIVQVAGNAPLYIYPMSDTPNTDTYSFYIEHLRNEILLKNDSIDYQAFYIGYPKFFKSGNYKSYLEFRFPYYPDTAHLVQFLKPDSATMLINSH